MSVGERGESVKGKAEGVHLWANPGGVRNNTSGQIHGWESQAAVAPIGRHPRGAVDAGNRAAEKVRWHVRVVYQ